MCLLLAFLWVALTLMLSSSFCLSANESIERTARTLRTRQQPSTNDTVSDPFTFICESNDPAHYFQRVDITFHKYFEPATSVRQYQLSKTDLEFQLQEYMRDWRYKSSSPLPKILGRQRWTAKVSRTRISFALTQFAASLQTMEFWMVQDVLECIDDYAASWRTNVKSAKILFELISHGDHLHIADGEIKYEPDSAEAPSVS